MIDKEKLTRLVELKQTLDDTEAEIAAILGGEVVKQKRHRRTKAEIEADKDKLPQTHL
ncbi:hypothetical protein [Bradyrhizobium sp. UNPF46]|uniref:hypothetical protein n=1 Tax=Bradyrhizobium sp. UNPF46 TaxID=1141168 RepID=UPI0015F08147|nr:hypothetical protein [Bradyrhizobium sp. UNPF46]